MLEHLAEVWNRPDHGIWERRGDGRHYVSSKVMTWVAFDRGIKSVETFGLKAPLEKWTTLRDTIHRDVCEKGFDPELNSFVESYGSKLLDASILMLPKLMAGHDELVAAGAPAYGQDVPRVDQQIWDPFGIQLAICYALLGRWNDLAPLLANYDARASAAPLLGAFADAIREAMAATKGGRRRAHRHLHRG